MLSHVRKFIDRIRDLNKGREAIVYHYDDYEKAGPSITPQINLAVMLSEVQGSRKATKRTAPPRSTSFGRWASSVSATYT